MNLRIKTWIKTCSANTKGTVFHVLMDERKPGLVCSLGSSRIYFIFVILILIIIIIT
jgi:hypothetical protein